MSRLLLLSLLVACLALGLLWRLTRNEAPRALPPSDVRVAEPASDPRAASKKSPLEIPTAERTHVDLPEGAKNVEPVAQVPIDDRELTLIDDPIFAAKYAGFTSAQLTAKVEELEPLYQTELERLCDLRFESGLYRVVAASEMEGIDASYDVLSAFDQQGVLSSARAVVIPDSGTPKPVTGEPEVQMEYQIVSLPPEIYPDLYRQRAELEWLRATLAARLAAGENPP